VVFTVLAAALHLRGQELSLRDIATRLVIATGKMKGRRPSPATAMRMLRLRALRLARRVRIRFRGRCAVPGLRPRVRQPGCPCVRASAASLK
jgi:hypothetical protein